MSQPPISSTTRSPSTDQGTPVSHAPISTAGAALSLWGLALGMIWIPAVIVVAVVLVALAIRYGFRRGRTPGDR
jgi:Flp pilus assembly protein TadB